MFGGADRGDSGRPVTVGEIMTRELMTLSPGDTLDDAMLVLSKQRIGALPVVEGDRLVGIVTKADILSALLSTLDIEGLGVRIEVVLRRDVKEVARLVAALADRDVEVRSLVLALHGADGYAAFVRVATIDVASVRDRLREKGFAVGELSDFYEARVKKETAPRGGAVSIAWVVRRCRADQAPLNSGFLEMKTSTIPATHAAEM